MVNKQRLFIPEIRKLNLLAESSFNKLVKKLDLTIAQGFMVYLLLENQGEGLNQRNLEHLMMLSNPAVTGVITRLEAKGFIRRSKSFGDRRYNIINPTEKCLALKEEFYSHIFESEDRILAGFTEEEQKLLYRFLKRMSRNLTKE
jgi:DNA-binding MarR family transcriptional regulator